MPGQHGGPYDPLAVTGTVCRQEYPADLPLTAEPPVSTTAREHNAAASASPAGNRRAGQQRQLSLLTVRNRRVTGRQATGVPGQQRQRRITHERSLPAGLTLRDDIGIGTPGALPVPAMKV